MAGPRSQYAGNHRKAAISGELVLALTGMRDQQRLSRRLLSAFISAQRCSGSNTLGNVDGPFILTVEPGVLCFP